MTAGTIERPTAYGVFKPVGHVLVALPPGSDLSAAVSAWVEAGFDGARITTYAPAQMKSPRK